MWVMISSCYHKRKNVWLRHFVYSALKFKVHLDIANCCKIRATEVSFAHWARHFFSMCSLMLWHIAPGPSCSSSHAPAPLHEQGNAPTAQHVRCAHDGRNASGNKRVFPGQHLAGSNSWHDDHCAGSNLKKKTEITARRQVTLPPITCWLT